MKTDFLNKTLEQLESEIWVEQTNFPSKLIKTIFLLRRKLLKDYTTEDLRISIGQNMGLPFLIPLAIKKLEENILAEGDMYPGDLLNSVLTADKNFWKSDKKNWNEINELCKKNTQKLNDNKQIIKNLHEFIAIHERN